MKKLICFMLSLMVVMPLAGCGESEAEKEQRMYEEASRNLEESQKNIDELEREIAELEDLQRSLNKAYGY